MVDETTSTTITPETVRQVAKLARLAIDEQHVQKYAAQLESILGYVEQIPRVPTSPASSRWPTPCRCTTCCATTSPSPALPLEKVLQNAPETDGPFFKVPKVIGGDEDSAG